MNALKKLSFLGIMLVLCFFQSCKKNGDPCPPDVNFDIHYIHGYSNNNSFESIKVICDTILNGQDITFEAVDSGASEYEWVIGEEPEVRKGQKLVIQFDIDNLSTPKYLNITLTAKFDPQNNCRNYPNNKKVVTRKMCIMPELQPAYVGKFRGYDTSAPNIIYDVEIAPRLLRIEGYTRNLLKIENLTQPFFVTLPILAARYNGYRNLVIWVWEDENFLAVNRCPANISGYGNCFVDKTNNNISITYHLSAAPDCRTLIKQTRTFVGVRIP
jgi:hypothetical protein